MPQALHVRTLNYLHFRYQLLATSRSGLFVIVLAIVTTTQLFGSRVSSANAVGISDLAGIVTGPAGALFGGLGDLAGKVGAGALKEALEWLFGGLESTITLNAMRSVTKVVELPALNGSNNSIVAAIYIMSIPTFAIGTMFAVSQAMYGSMSSSEPLGGYGRVIIRTVVLVVAAAAWYPIVQLLVYVTNDLSSYLLSDPVIGENTRESFAEAKTDKLAPILMLLVYLILAVSWLLLVVAKGVITLAFVMVAIGGPMILALSTFPPARNMVNWLMTTVATLIAIPALWAFVFCAWAFIGSSLWNETFADEPSQLYKASLFIAAMIAIYGVTKRALAMGRMGIPGGIPGGGVAKMGMGLAAAYAGRNVAAGLLSKGTATQTVSHELPDGSTVSQKTPLRGAAAKRAMDDGARHSADPASARAQNTAARQSATEERTRRIEDAKRSATAAANPGTIPAPGSAVHPDGNTMSYDRNGSLSGPSGETQARHKAAWDREISKAATSQRPTEDAVRQAGASFSSADRAAFHQLAVGADSNGRTPAQAQAHFSDRVSSVMAGSNISTSSGVAPDGMTIATASPATAAAAFAPADPPSTGGPSGGADAFRSAAAATGGADAFGSASAAGETPSAAPQGPNNDIEPFSVWKDDRSGRSGSQDVGAAAGTRAAESQARAEAIRNNMEQGPFGTGGAPPS